MIVWGGGNSTGDLNTGGRYNPATNSWTATSTASGLYNRSSHTAVWTGTEMIVWGGIITHSISTDGSRYNPVTDSWTGISRNGPSARDWHTAVWTGNQMIVWGGRAVALIPPRNLPLQHWWKVLRAISSVAIREHQYTRVCADGRQRGDRRIHG